MAKSQFPLDGKNGKDWKVTSPFGWRIHPISKVKKHHNGADLWQAKEPSYLEAWCDGKVVNVIEKNDEISGGNQVVVQSTVMGKKITWIYMHMVHKSIQVKKGQKITAGTVIGKMGETGFATGKHLHWEIWDGHRTSQPNTMNGGKGFYDPIAFTNAVIEWEKTHATLNQVTPEDVVHEAPAHSAPDTGIAPATPATAPAKPILKKGSKGAAVKELQKKLGIAADGDFGPGTEAAVNKFKKAHGLKADGIVGAGTWKALG